MMMAGMMLWPSALVAGGQDRSQSPPPVKTPQAPHLTVAPPGERAKPAELGTAKVVPRCGFCLEDGTKVALLLGRELVSSKEVTGNRVDFEVAEEIRVENV